VLVHGGSALFEEGENFVAHLGLGNEWGDPVDSPRPVALPAGTVCVEVAAGSLHSLFLSGAGVVYSVGGGWEGPLGHGDEGSIAVPRPIAFNVRIESIAAGGAHSLAIDAHGAAWSWGWGRHGQLGHGDERSHNMPLRIAGLGGVVQVAAGAAHSLALCTDGTVCSFGRAADGQCGTSGGGAAVLVPTRVDALAALDVREVRASADTSAALVAAEPAAVLYRWGAVGSAVVPLPRAEAAPLAPG